MVRRREPAAAAHRRRLYACRLAGDGGEPPARRGGRLRSTASTSSIDNTQAGIDIFVAGLFPEQLNETHTFVLRNPQTGSQRTVTMQSANVTLESRAERHDVDPNSDGNRRLHAVQRSFVDGRAGTSSTPSRSFRPQNVDRPRARPAIQRRRLAGDRQRDRLHDRRQRADSRPAVRAPRLQRQAHGRSTR